MDVTVNSRPPIPSETFLPSRLIELLLSHGLRPTWQKHSAELLSTYHGIGMRPVTGKVLEEVGYKADPTEFYVSPEGFVQKLDCVLMVQPLAQWQERQGWKEQIASHQQSGKRHRDELNDALEQIVRNSGIKGVSGGLHQGTTTVPDASAHIGIPQR